MARARGPGWVPRPSGCSSRRCTNSGVPYPVPEAPHSPGSRAGPGAAAPCGHALFTSASALALPLVAVSACALRTSRSDSAKNNKSLPPAARRRLPSTDTASGIARRSASPPRPRDGHAPSDHAPVAHASSLTKTTPSLAARRHHAPDGHAPRCPSPWVLLHASTCSCLIAELLALSIPNTPGAGSVLLSQGRGCQASVTHTGYGPHVSLNFQPGHYVSMSPTVVYATHCDPEAAGASPGLGRENRGQLASDHVLDLTPSPRQGGEVAQLHHIISKADAPYKGERDMYVASSSDPYHDLLIYI